MLHKKIFTIFLAVFLSVIANRSYADLPIDDMDSLVEDEASVEKESYVPQDRKEGIKDRFKSYYNLGKGIFQSKDKDENSDVENENVENIEEIETVASTTVSDTNIRKDFLRYNLILIIAGGVCGLFFILFIGILYFLYIKTKKLSEKAQVSKDLAEKYFYNIHEHQDGYGKIKKEMESKITSIDEEIDIKVSLKIKELDNLLFARIKDIMGKVQNGEKIANIEAQEPDSLKPLSGGDNKQAVGSKKSKIDTDMAVARTPAAKVSDQTDIETKISDNKSMEKGILDNEGVDNIDFVLDEVDAGDIDKEMAAKPPAIPKKAHVDGLGDIDDIFETTDYQREKKDIPKAAASSHTDSVEGGLDILESLLADDSDADKTEESRALLKGKKADKDVPDVNLIGEEEGSLLGEGERGGLDLLISEDKEDDFLQEAEKKRRKINNGKNKLVEQTISDDEGILESLDSIHDKDDNEDEITIDDLLQVNNDEENKGKNEITLNIGIEEDGIVHDNTVDMSIDDLILEEGDAAIDEIIAEEPVSKESKLDEEDVVNVDDIVSTEGGAGDSKYDFENIEDLLPIENGGEIAVEDIMGKKSTTKEEKPDNEEIFDLDDILATEDGEVNKKKK